MDPFSISCTTCRARLKVGSADAIGQILACPKCGSMVLVEPPPSETGAPPSEATHASDPAAPVSAATAGVTIGATFDEAASLLSDEPPVAHPPQAEPADAGLPLSEPPVNQNTVDQTQGAADTATAATHPYPDATWESPAQQWLRRWAMIGGTAVAGMALAVGIWAYVHSRNKDDTKPAPVAATTPERTSPDVAPDDAESGSADPAATPDSADDEAHAAGDATPSEPSVAEVDDDAPEADAAHHEEISQEPAAETDQAADADDSDATVATPSVEDVPEDDGTELSDADPLGIRGGLGRFDALMNDPAAGTQVTASGPTDSPTDMHEAPTPPAERQRPAPRKIDVEARLAEPVHEIDFARMPLVDFLDFLSQMSTIPMTLDPEAVAFVRTTPMTPVSIRQRDTTIGKILSAALAPRALGYVIRDGNLLVGKAAPADGKLRSLAFPMADLGGDDPLMLARLADLAREVVDPDSWDHRGGLGVVRNQGNKLIFTQTAANHFQLLVLYEKLRVARGTSPISRGYDRKLFQLTTRTARIRDKLSSDVTLKVHFETPISQVLGQLRERTGVTFLIDWQSLTAAGWPPVDTQAAVVVENRPLSATLSAMLGPMGLTYRAVDENTIQITSIQSLETRPEIELYQVSDLVEDPRQGKQLVEEILAALGPELFREGGGSGVIHLEEVSRCLIVRLPQVKQRALETLLKQLIIDSNCKR